MNLETTLNMLAAQLHIDANKLIEYAAEDAIGGYHWNAIFGKWPTGSVFEVEGKTLYALVRYFKPYRIVEIGGLWGCSTAHIAAALKANDNGGIVASVDSHALEAEHGGRIPDEYRPFVRLVSNDGEKELNAYPVQSIDMVFSDADHATETTRRIAAAAIPKLIDGGLFIEHDAQHDFAILGDGSRIPVTEGKAIRDGLNAAGLDYRVYLTEPSDCGLAVAQIKHEKMLGNRGYSRLGDDEDTFTIQGDGTIVYDEKPSEKPEQKKRTRRKRNAKGELE